MIWNISCLSILKKNLKIIPNQGRHAEKHIFSFINKEKENKRSERFRKALWKYVETENEK